MSTFTNLLPTIHQYFEICGKILYQLNRNRGMNRISEFLVKHVKSKTPCLPEFTPEAIFIQAGGVNG